MSRRSKSPAARPLNLALQGGGSHGAFTWGVLDALLEAERFTFDHVSATSAGAVNAVALADGLARGGPADARVSLKRVWDAVVAASGGGSPRAPAAATMLRGIAGASLRRMTRMMSPYDFNPLAMNPLRDLLVEQIDFDTIRQAAPVALLIAATDISSGEARLFTTAELTADVVLASACLPTLFQAVEIGGRHYWDGGFSANPDILTLARQSATADTLVVLLNPRMRDGGPPRSISAITGEVDRLTFSRPFAGEVATLAAVRRAGWLAARRKGAHALYAHRFHLIEAGAHTGPLPVESKMLPSAALVRHLFEAGRREAKLFLEENGDAVGRRETASPERLLGSDGAADLRGA